MLKIVNLKTEYKTNPIGLAVQNPCLSWELVSDKRDVMQLAWQLVWASCAADLDSERAFDSGKITSGQSINIEYPGSKLQSGQRVYWKVKVWSNQGDESDWSEPAYWEMGLLHESDWKAQWIEPDLQEDYSVSNPCPYLRKEFPAAKEIKKATVYVTSRGLYELSINGQKVSDHLFTPGWTSYHYRLQYQVYDVTEQLAKGTNTLGVILADGWYRGFLVWQGNKNLYGEKLALLLQLKIEYADGSFEYICSDENWKASTGPIRKSDIYNGELYDARMELKGWNCNGYNDTGWTTCKIAKYGLENLVASDGEPVRITETIRPVQKIITPAGELVFDMGQNMVGWIRFRLKGKAGEKITIHHAEVLDQEGNFYTDNLRTAKAEDVYIFNGDGVETFEPRFTFHGFRYVRISDYPGEISLNDLEGRVVHSDMKTSGEFECSDELINRLQKNIDWGLRGNFLDVPTDCPQRDERLGWTGDAQVFAPTACFNREAVNFYRKWMKDFIVDQKADGSVPWVVPNVVENGGGTGWSDGFGSTAWADAAVVIPWTVYTVYGDKRILQDQYQSMKGWVEYMIREAGESYIFNSGFHFGDWLSFAEYYSYNYNAPDYGYAGAHTDKELITTAYFYYTTGLLQKIAEIVGNKEDSEKYKSILPKIKEAFQKEFITASGRLVSATQTAYVIALCFGLLPAKMIPVVAKRLAGDVNYFGHLTTGFVGTPLLCKALSDFGYPDEAFKLLFNKRYPSWLYPVTMGATTIWERWDGIKPDGTFQTVGMNSFNHYAYGAVGDWLYSRVAGINTDEKESACRKIVFRPLITEKLDFVTAKYQSVYGTIVSSWKRTPNGLVLEYEVPANTSAEVYLPVGSQAPVLEDGRPVKVQEVASLYFNNEKQYRIDLGSGNYRFLVNEK